MPVVSIYSVQLYILCIFISPYAYIENESMSSVFAVLLDTLTISKFPEYQFIP